MMSMTYTRAMDAVSGLEALRADGLMSVPALTAVVGGRNAYRLLSCLYRAAGRDTAWTHVHSIPGLYAGQPDRLSHPLRPDLWGSYSRIG